MYVDGFVIRSMRYGDSLEISGIGHKLILVRTVTGLKPSVPTTPMNSEVVSTPAAGTSKSPSARLKARTVMGGEHGTVVCTVQIIGPNGESVESSDMYSYWGLSKAEVATDIFQPR